MPVKRDAPLEALRFWAEGRPIRDAMRSRWDDLCGFIDLHSKFVDEERIKLRSILARTSPLFSPLGDPLDFDFGTHRWLSGQREESYSDWLAWVFERCGTWDVVARVLGIVNGFSGSAPVQVDREVCVRSKSDGTRGRLDIEVRSAERQLCVIEVKTQPYGDEGVAKHSVYCASAEVTTDAIKIFLAVEQEEDCDLGGFRFVGWRQVCIGLRAEAMRMLRDRRAIEAAMVLAFVSSVEQNLLKSGSMRGSVVRTLQYLEDFTGGDNALDAG
jgi:hypothetical protein